jgi:hypothetical protein
MYVMLITLLDTDGSKDPHTESFEILEHLSASDDLDDPYVARVRSLTDHSEGIVSVGPVEDRE